MRLRTASYPILALLAVLGAPPAWAQDIHAGITSTQAATAVSVSADPQLSDGRLVLRIAAQNRTSAPLAFGPANIRVTLAGKPVALIPLDRLIADVRIAAGLAQESDVTLDNAGSQAAPPILTNNSGQKDVSGYTGNMGASSAAPIRVRRTKKVAPAEVAAAEAQIAGLKAGILTDRSIAPGEIAAGQVVTEKLRRGRDRAVELSITIGGETHSFKFDAPAG